jgi:hypothetical protein
MERIKKWQELGNERYDFDFNRCTPVDGWAQVDTSQDASYFGTWANPIDLRVMSFVEGDCTLFTADSPEDFVTYVREAKKWNDDHGYKFGIDTHRQGVDGIRITEAFNALGLGDLLH